MADDRPIRFGDESARVRQLAQFGAVGLHGEQLAAQGVRAELQVLELVAAEDLLLSKLHWAKDRRSELQLADVRNLIACGPDLDWSSIEQWAPQLSVTGLLREVRP